MIKLGSHDRTIASNSPEIKAYMAKVKKLIPSSDQLKDSSGAIAPFTPIKDNESMTVSAMQQGLKDTGFFPGGDIDGICGYRTVAAMRLFQEYVRTVEGKPEIGIPDGEFGPKTTAHLKRWLEAGQMADYVAYSHAWRQNQLPADSQYAAWLRLLNKVKAHYTGNPTLMLEKVNNFQGDTDTVKVNDWDFDPRHIHMVGIRRKKTEGAQAFDDVLMLLIKGMVFTFQGSTDPGHTSNAKGAPFLAQGQHNYHFGWHQGKYHALRPLHYGQHGVLVARSAGDFILTDADISKGLTPNGTINIHWGGRGVARNVNSWSEGCQIIAGSGYINQLNQLVECKKADGSSFVALNNGKVSSSQTRGAYNMLADLVTALSGDMDSSVVKYMLLVEDDLAMDPEVAGFVMSAHKKAVPLIEAGG